MRPFFHFNLQKQCVCIETHRVPILGHRGRYSPSMGRETLYRELCVNVSF